jgi:hypothetical protein
VSGSRRQNRSRRAVVETVPVIKPLKRARAGRLVPEGFDTPDLKEAKALLEGWE